MKSFMDCLRILLIAMVGVCAFNSLMVELKLVARGFPQKSGVMLGEPQGLTDGARRRDGQYDDFWMTEGPPSRTGFSTKVDDADRSGQVQFPSSF